MQPAPQRILGDIKVHAHVRLLRVTFEVRHQVIIHSNYPVAMLHETTATALGAFDIHIR